MKLKVRARVDIGYNVRGQVDLNYICMYVLFFPNVWGWFDL